MIYGIPGGIVASALSGAVRYFDGVMSQYSTFAGAETASSGEKGSHAEAAVERGGLRMNIPNATVFKRRRRLALEKDQGVGFRMLWVDSHHRTRVEDVCRERSSPDFPSVPFIIILINFAFFFVSGLFVGTVAERLVLRQAAHTDPDRLFLRFYFKRPLG